MIKNIYVKVNPTQLEQGCATLWLGTVYALDNVHISFEFKLKVVLGKDKRSRLANAYNLYLKINKKHQPEAIREDLFLEALRNTCRVFKNFLSLNSLTCTISKETIQNIRESFRGYTFLCPGVSEEVISILFSNFITPYCFKNNKDGWSTRKEVLVNNKAVRELQEKYEFPADKHNAILVKDRKFVPIIERTTQENIYVASKYYRVCQLGQLGVLMYFDVPIMLDSLAQHVTNPAEFNLSE